jgi:hypothetical protein
VLRPAVDAALVLPRSRLFDAGLRSRGPPQLPAFA